MSPGSYWITRLIERLFDAFAGRLPEGVGNASGIGGETSGTPYQKTWHLLNPLRSPDINDTFSAWGELANATPTDSVKATMKNIEALFGHQISDAVRTGDAAAIAGVKVVLGDGGAAIVDAVVNNPGDENAVKRLSEAASSRILVPANAPLLTSRSDGRLSSPERPLAFRIAVRDISKADPNLAIVVLAADQLCTDARPVLHTTVEDLVEKGLNSRLS